MTMAIPVASDLWGKIVHRMEVYILRASRRRGRADYTNPHRYVLGDREELFGWCAAATEDLLAYLRPEPEAGALAGPGAAGALTVSVEPALGPGGPREVIRFASGRPSGVAENDTVVAHRWRARGRSEGAIVFHHPAFHTTIDWVEWFARGLRSRFDIVLMESPFHLSRAPRGWFSGERLVNPDPRHLFEGMRQWMSDATRLLAALGEAADRGDAGARPRGVVGYSMGAYLSILEAHFRPDLPVVAVCSGNDFARGVYEGDLAEALRARIGELGLSRDDWETLTGSLKLHRLAGRIPGDRVCLISGIHERVEPFSSIERFHAAFPARKKILLPYGHATVGLLCRGRVVREVRKLVDEVEGEDTRLRA